MLAAHRDGTSILLHDPRTKARIPLVLDVASGEMTVSLPSACDLAENYIDYRTVADLKKAQRDHERVIDRGLRFSRHYTELLSHDARFAQMDLATLRDFIGRHYLVSKTQVDRQIGNIDDTGGVRLAGMLDAAVAA